MFEFLKIEKNKSLFTGSLLVGISLILGYFEKAFFFPEILLSPADALSSRVTSLPTTSFFILLLAAVAIIMLGVAGLIFLIIGLNDK